MGKLYVGSPDDLNGLDNVIGIFLKPLLKLGRYGEHGGRTKGITGVDTHGIHILNKTDRYHLVFAVPNDLKLQFLPSQNRFLHQNLAHKTG